MAKSCVMTNPPIIQLSYRARQTLETIAQSSANGREVRRAQALLWLAAGAPVQEVARRLTVSRQMIYALIERYGSRRESPVLERIQDADHPGRPASKRLLVATEVHALLKHPPSDYGYRGYVWTIGMLKTQITKKHAMSVSDDTVQRALHALDYRCKRPRYVLARRDPHWHQVKGGSKLA
jgi:transposase